MEAQGKTSTAGLTRDEREVFARVSRRGFMGATAAATLSALIGREPRVQASQARPTTATADAVIVLWPRNFRPFWEARSSVFTPVTRWLESSSAAL